MPEAEPFTSVSTAPKKKSTVPESTTLVSVEELKAMSVKELQEMLTQRGVGHKATEKEDLVMWVNQHQHLPVVQSSHTSTRDTPSRSVDELKKMPVAELKEMLRQRGVSEGSATEKAELATWVWQHQHLPIRYEASGNGSRGFGYGPGGSGVDSEKKEPEKGNFDQIEADDTKQIEGDETKLLEGEACDASEERRWHFMRVIVASFGLLAILIGAVAANDAMQASEEK